MRGAEARVCGVGEGEVGEIFVIGFGVLDVLANAATRAQMGGLTRASTLACRAGRLS